jgi:hypothetical protein
MGGGVYNLLGQVSSRVNAATDEKKPRLKGGGAEGIVEQDMLMAKTFKAVIVIGHNLGRFPLSGPRARHHGRLMGQSGMLLTVEYLGKTRPAVTGGAPRAQNEDLWLV